MKMTPILSSKEDGSIPSNCSGIALIMNRKRKADVLGRRISSTSSVAAIPTPATEVSSSTAAAAASATVSSSTSGRGSLVGWASCPLCGPYSKKRFALGRGIAAHLHAVHTPWNKPSKAERRRQEKRQRHTAEQQQQQKSPMARTAVTTQPEELQRSIAQSAAAGAAVLDESYQPTPEQVEAWEEQVLQIINQLEQEAHAQKAVIVAADPPISDATAPTPLQPDGSTTTAPRTTNSNSVEQHRQPPPPPGTSQGRDRNGNHVPSYRDSLSPFLKAAANGDLATLQQMVTEAAAAAVKSDSGNSSSNNAIIRLLETRDRHLSTAEHWAAGEGHLECLQFLLSEKKKANEQNKNTDDGTSAMSSSSSSCAISLGKKVRRRDGKTCLHYAARNGHLECVQYLLDEHAHQHGQSEFKVDEVSGDGTTPFHLACWNLQLIVAKFLVQRGANPKATNEWGCSAAHWVGMARGCRDDVEQHQQQEHHQQQGRLRAKVREMCNWMQEELGVSFVDRQKQGHCALHKAAQHCNQYFIEWLAQPKDQGGAGLTNDEKVQVGLADLGGHIPSEIWRSSGGNESFAKWMKDELGW